MATQWISPTWRMPENSNQSKVDNYSLDFNGTNETISCGVINELVSATNFSLSGWFYFDSVANNKTLYSYGGATGTNQYSMTIQTFASGNLIFVIANATTDAGSNYIQTNLASVLTTSTWYHIVCTYDGSQAGNTDKAKIYINGTEVAYAAGGGTIPATTSASTGPFNIGQWELGGSNRFFDGEIGQVSVYGSTLTPTQITALYNSGTPVNPMALTPLPVAYYPLGGGSIGNSTTLTVPNESVADATVFNFVESSTQYIDIGTNNSVLMPTDEMSISLWVKFSSAAIGAYRGLFSANSAGGNDGYLIWKRNTNVLQFLIRESGAWRTASFSPAVVQDVWYHVVGTWDGTDVKIYVDNVVGGTTATASSITYNASTVNRIGDYGIYEMDGDMANVQFWNKGLSAANVTTLYNNGVPLYTGTQPEAANLKGWWKLNVDTSNWNGTDWIIGEAQANYTTALEGDGVNTHIDLTSDVDLGINSTISLWINSNIALASLADMLLGIDFTYLLIIQNSKIYVNIGGAFGEWASTDGFALTSGTWYNITMVRTGDSIEIFQDNVSLGTKTGFGEADNTLFDSIAARASGAFSWAGKISNVSAFNTALSGSDITTLYNNGTPPTDISALNPVGWWKLDNLTTGIQDQGSGSNNGVNSGMAEVDSFVSNLNGLSSGMTTANLVTSDLTRSIPYSSYSMQFDATNDYVIVPANVLTNFTTSVWLNRDGNGNYDGILGQNTTSAKGGILRYVALQDDDIYIYLDAWYTVATTLALNTWIHFCLTYDSTADELKSYINGILDTTIASPDFSGASTDAHSFTRIGLRNGTDATSFPGKLNNVSLFNSALSEDQILTIYNGGVPNDISSLSPVSWWSLGGDSYYNGTDWICPDLGSAGNNGTSANMAGTEIIGDGPGSTANGTATNMDIPANLKGEAPNSTSNAFSINMTEIDRVTSVPG